LRARQIRGPIQKTLETDTFYAIFIRVYYTDNSYQSTPWYDAVKIEITSGIEPWLLVVIILSIFLFVVSFVLVIYCLVKRVHHEEPQPSANHDIINPRTQQTDLMEQDPVHFYHTIANQEVRSDRIGEGNDTYVPMGDIKSMLNGIIQQDEFYPGQVYQNISNQEVKNDINLLK